MMGRRILQMSAGRVSAAAMLTARFIQAILDSTTRPEAEAIPLNTIAGEVGTCDLLAPGGDAAPLRHMVEEAQGHLRSLGKRP